MDIYFQLALCFTSIALCALVAEKTSSFFAPFYIMAGLILGPFGLGLVENGETISVLGEIGVVFLLFFLGFEFSLHTFIEKRKSMLKAGIIDLTINFSLGFIFGQILGVGVFYSIVIAGAVYMSSSGIVTKSLVEMELSKMPEGRLIMGIMVFEDLVMILFLLLITLGIDGINKLNPINILYSLSKAILFCSALLIMAKKCSHLLDKILSFKRQELILLIFFSTVLIITSIGKEMGVSEALGAFFLGIAFSNAKNAPKIEHLTITFRDLFGSVFFFSFGMILDISKILDMGWILVIGAFIAIIGKLLSGFIISRFLKCHTSMGLFIGFITVPRGEFSLLISRTAGSSLPFLAPFMVFMVLLTTAISMIILRISKTLCKVYNSCFIYPKNRIFELNQDWGEID